MIVHSAAELHTIISQSLEDPSVISVFPTETALRFWIEHHARTSTQGIIRHDRAMAWDRFRSSFLPKRTQTPANRLVRQVFALNLLQGEEARSLRWFCYPEGLGSAESLVSPIERLLVRMEELSRVRDEDGAAYGRLPAAYRHDVEFLGNRYRSFLAAHEFYEPHFLSPSPQEVTDLPRSRYRVFFPEVCDRWDRFAGMKDFPSWIETCTAQPEATVPLLHVYENEMMELRRCLTDAARLLDAGVHPQQIMITIADLNRWLPYLEHEGALEDVPLSIVMAQPILSFPPGRFLQGLHDLQVHRFSLEYLRSFLLDPRIPWRSVETHRNLIRRGIELQVVHGSNLPGQDDWNTKLSRFSGRQDKSLLDWYKTLKGHTLALTRAKDPGKVTQAFYALRRFLLADEGWNERDAEGVQGRDSRILDFCLQQLSELGRTLVRLSQGETERLYSWFVRILGQQQYVPETRTRGIPVYPYGVSVGLCPTHHMILGCTLDATRVESARLPLVPEYASDGVLTENKSETFLSHYALTGETVHYSAATRGFGNVSALTPSWFVDREAVVHVHLPAEHLQHREQESWASAAPGTFVANERQERQLSYALFTAFKPPRVDIAAPHGTIPIIGRLAAGGALPTLSSTGMDRFFSCPMKWAANSLMHLEKGPYDMQGTDHAAIGICLHRILEQFFRSVAAEGPYDATRAEAYRVLLSSIIEAVFAEHGRQADAPPNIVLHHIGQRYAAQLMKLIDEESELFDGFLSTGFETPMEKSYEDAGYSLNGRIDRILVHSRSEPEGQLAVVDYKKSSVATRRQYDGQSERIPSHQLPFYAKLLRDVEGRQVGIGAFYDIGKGAYHRIWEEGEEQRRDALIALVEAHAKIMVDALREGRLGARVSKEGCSFCDYRQICRKRYALS
ncbi:MAG: PD-(D/E)XK nuclease family protein [Sphaerochaetaceae bacterium]|nr:PD-(D/E)XK nuclease family protein [Sphaerochaetaceae bacterium]